MGLGLNDQQIEWQGTVSSHYLLKYLNEGGRRLVLFWVFGLAFQAASAADSKPNVFVKEAPDICIGSENAPMTVIEYTSLTCDHCASFHKDVLPLIKEKYVDTGQVRFVFRHFPLDRDALQAAAVITCLPEMNRYVAMTQLFFSQDRWISQKDVAPLGQAMGMDLADCQKCLKDETIQDAVLQQRIKGEKGFNVDATPTFVINGEILEGIPSLEDIEKFIAQAGHP